MFCGDAMADPITGLVAALAVLEALAQGGGLLLDLSMAAASSSVLPSSSCSDPTRWSSVLGPGGEQLELEGRRLEIQPPSLPLGVGA